MDVKRSSEPAEDALEPTLIRLDRGLRERLDRYCGGHSMTLAAAVRSLLGEALGDHEARQIDQHPQGAVLYEKIQRLHEELGRLERFMREVARTTLGTEIVLAHWAAVAGGGRGADEDRILDEMRKAGEHELRAFLEKECPGLFERLAVGRKKPPVH